MAGIFRGSRPEARVRRLPPVGTDFSGGRFLSLKALPGPVSGRTCIYILFFPLMRFYKLENRGNVGNFLKNSCRSFQNGKKEVPLQVVYNFQGPDFSGWRPCTHGYGSQMSHVSFFSHHSLQAQFNDGDLQHSQLVYSNYFIYAFSHSCSEL